MNQRPYRPANLPGLIPYLSSPDPMALGTFLLKAFGLEFVGDPLEEGGKVVHIQMKSDDAFIMVGLEGYLGSQARSPKSAMTGEQGIALYLYVRDVDGHFAKAKAAGAEISKELEDSFWGDRIYSAKDADGNHWTFATTTKFD